MFMYDEKTIVDCIFDVGEQVDLKTFLSSYRNPYPIYYIAEAICKEMPEDSIKYKEIKRYVDSKLEMKRGCKYDAVVRIVWAAIRYTYPNVRWDELSLMFKEYEKKPIVTLNKNDSIENTIEKAKQQVEEYFATHENVPENIKEYIRANIEDWDSIENIKYMLGNVFDVRIVN